MPSIVGARRLAALVVPAALLVAAPAHAAPAKTVTLGTAKTAKWDGTGSGVLATQDAMDRAGCTPGIHDCYDVLIHVTIPGFVTVHTSSTDPKAVDTDLQLFFSDAKGTVSDEIAESAQAAPTPDETVGSLVDPGYYIARIDYAIAAAGVVHADATFEPDSFAAASKSTSSKTALRKRAARRTGTRR